VPFRHGKITVFKLGTFATPTVVVDLSAFLTEVRKSGSADTPETTAFGATNKTYVVGVPDAALTVTGYFDAVPDAQLGALVGTEVAPNFEYGPEGSTAGRVKYTGTMFVASYDLTNSITGVVGFTANMVPASAVARSTW
jgi:hypothetical protein